MAYPYNFFGGGANPYGYQQFGYNGYQQYQPTPQMPQQPLNQQQSFQPPMQTAQQPSAPQTQYQSGGFVEVKDYSEVEQFPVAPGNIVTFIRLDRKKMYTKSASHNQLEAPVITAFKIIKEDSPEEVKDAPENIYATKEELITVVGAVKGFDEIIGSIKADIDTMKGDIYGVVGKKKAVKKSKEEEVEDDD